MQTAETDVLSENDTDEERHPERANAIEKALALLMAFTPGNHPLTNIELSRLTGFHKATTARILATLVEKDFLRQEPVSKRFYLGETVMKLASAIKKSLAAGLVPLIKPHLDSLSERTGQTVTLEIPSGTASVMACVIEGPRVIRVAGQVGDILPWNVAAGLRCMLAHSSPGGRERSLSQPMQEFTDRTITTRADYLASLDKVLRDGFSFEDEEFCRGISALGVPVFDFESKVLAAICVVGFSSEVNAENTELVELMKQTARDASAEFYYRP